jgi:hypothetical protein
MGFYPAIGGPDYGPMQPQNAELWATMPAEAKEIETCRQQGRKTFTFVADAVHVHFAGHAAASLLTGV